LVQVSEARRAEREVDNAPVNAALGCVGGG
jgi:hypothetical protein